MAVDARYLGDAAAPGQALAASEVGDGRPAIVQARGVEKRYDTGQQRRG